MYKRFKTAKITWRYYLVDSCRSVFPLRSITQVLLTFTMYIFDFLLVLMFSVFL